MANRCHDRHTGRFISAAHGRVQNVQRLADLSDDEWALEEEALTILKAGMAKAIQDGWVAPDNAEVDVARASEIEPDLGPEIAPWAETIYMRRVRAGGRWPRARRWGRQVRAATTLLLAGVA